MAEQDGGIMQKIQAITAPPHPSPTSKQRRGKAKAINHTLPSTSRQSGVDNHPYCDACGDGGNLLCCERCPASFHFVCCDPPLDPLTLPEGEWVCNSCRPSPANIDSYQNTLFRTLLTQACSENPLIFDLPPEMMERATFQDIKQERKSLADSGTGNAFCHLCNRSSRFGPMLKCDFCPLCYHMDCLTPPITDSPLPTSWMCPNHIEHSISGLHSMRLSERKKALEKCRADICRYSIKVDFLTKLKQIPHYKRITARTNRRATEVPASIKALYASPLEDSQSVAPLSRLLLTASEHLELLRKEGERERENLHLTTSPFPTQTQDELTINGMLLERLGGPAERTSSTQDDLQEILDCDSSLCNGVNRQTDNIGIGNRDKEDTPTRLPLIMPNVDLLDSKIVKVLANQRLQQLLSDGLLPHKTLNGLKQQDIPISSPAPSSLSHSASTAVAGVKRKRDYNSFGLLCPLSTAGPAVPILTTSITIGSGSEMDVCLRNYGYCNYVSPHHACLILDRETGEYELINYSEHGSIVDGVLYSCDFSEKTSPDETLLLLDDVLSIGEGRRSENAKRRLENARSALRDKERAKAALSSALKLSKSINRDCVIDPTLLPEKKRTRSSSSDEPSSPDSSVASLPSSKRLPSSKPQSSHHRDSPLDRQTVPFHMTNRFLSADNSHHSCLCKRSASSLIGGSGKGWEGSALVSHGSRLRFGCIQLMLSVNDKPGHSELLKALIDAHLL